MSGNIAPLITTTIGTGVALAGLMIGLFAWMRTDIADHRKETGELRERMAHLEGLLEGLHEAIVSRAA